jgi:hypothetical protein
MMEVSVVVTVMGRQEMHTEPTCEVNVRITLRWILGKQILMVGGF